MENLNASESTVCSVFQTYPYVIVATLSACAGTVSALCCIVVICLIFLLKKHYFFIQRMILYHCLAILLRALAVILRFYRPLVFDMDGTVQDMLCTISGFTNQLTLWILIMNYSILTFTLLMTAIYRKNVARLERLYVVLIFVFPLTFNWIPFIGNSYGYARAWCWIRSVNFDDDCSEHRLGMIFGTVLWNVPFFAILFVMIPTYLFTIFYVARKRFCKRKKNTKISYDPEMDRLKQHLNKEVWPILFFPFGLILLNVTTVINALFSFTGSPPVYPIWILHGMFAELQGAYSVLIFVLDHKTWKRLTYKNVKAAISRARGETVHEYPISDGGGAVSDSAVHSLAITTARRDTVTVQEYPSSDGGGTVSESTVYSPEAGYRQYSEINRHSHSVS